MPATIVQQKAGGSATPGDPFNITLDTPTTAGNLVFICAGGDTVLALGVGTGLTERFNFIGSSNQHSVWDKITAGGETAWSINPSANASTSWYAAEISGLTATPFDKSASLSGTAATQATGTTATTAQADEFLIGVWIAWCNASALRTWASYTNSFVEVSDFGHATGTIRTGVAVATRTVSATGAYTSTATVSSTTSTDQTASICTYRIDTAGPAADIPSLVMARSV